jgi:hypothetical protein
VSFEYDTLVEKTAQAREQGFYEAVDKLVPAKIVLDGLIASANSSIPVQTSELVALRRLLEIE